MFDIGGYMGEERRVYERKTLRGPARIVLRGTPATIVRMLDISLGGACILTEFNVPTKKSFQLEFNILVRKTNAVAGIRVSSIVTHVAFSNSEGGFKIGLQFLGLTDLQRQLIHQYMDVRIPKADMTDAVQITKDNSNETSENQANDLVDKNVAR
jgi:hypothetical protein